MLLGESGTGKDIFAQAIHNNERPKKRSVCRHQLRHHSPGPDRERTVRLFGRRLFRFRRGGNQGKFELADGGTIFLDEIAEMPLELQAALLRVIEDKSIMRIGGTKVTTVDVRIIAATNKNLKEEVEKGKFREDLYYRLNVFTISMIPLRERKEISPSWRAVSSIRSAGPWERKSREWKMTCSTSCRTIIGRGTSGNCRMSWRGVINITHTDALTVDLLPPEITNFKLTKSGYEIETFDDIERKLITSMLRSNLPKGEIADKLGISRSTLYRKLGKYERANSRKNASSS